MHFIKSNFIKHQRTILLILLFLVVGTMTIGYASFQTILTLRGTITIKYPDPVIKVDDVSFNSGDNVISMDPVINERSVILNDSYSSNNGSSTYIISITNYTDQNYIYNGYSSNVEINNDNVTYSLNTSITNILPGDVIAPLETKEIIISMNYSGNNVDSIEITNSIEFFLETNPVGNISIELSTNEISVLDDNQLDLNIVNTLISERYVEYRIDNNKFELVDTNGDLLTSVRYDSGYMNTDSIYIRLKDGVELTQDESVTLYAWLNGSSRVLGVVTVHSSNNKSFLPTGLSMDDESIEVGTIISASNGDSFYVISYDETTGVVRALSKNALKKDSTNNYVQSSSFDKITFGSSTSYESSNVKKYADGYYTYLTGLGIDIDETDTITKEELVELGCSTLRNSCSSAPDWVTSTSYWTKSVSGSQVYYVDKSNYFEPGTISSGGWDGSRPVIVFTVNNESGDPVVDPVSLMPNGLSTSSEEFEVGTLITASNNDKFYVIDYNESTGVVRALSKNALKKDSTNNYVQSSSFDKITFGSSTNYESSNVKKYADGYYTYLTGLGIDIDGTDTITKEELVELGCSTSRNSCSSAPDWVTSTSYWTKSVSGSQVYYVDKSNYFEPGTISSGGWDGSRPIIIFTINKSN